VRLSRSGCRGAVLACCAAAVFWCSPAVSAERIATGLFGLWAWPDWDQALAIVKDNGFDVVVGMSKTSELDKEAAAGVKVLVGLGLTPAIAEDEANWPKYLEGVKARVAQLKDHPALLAWYVVDEPDLWGISLEKIRAVREAVRAVDQRTPHFTVFANPAKWSAYLPYFDIVAVDPYLHERTPGAAEKPVKVAQWLAKIQDDLKRAGLERPVWVVLGAFELKTRSAATRKPTFYRPTPGEFNEMVKIAVDAGVGGILVFTLAKTFDPAYEDLNLPKDDPALWEAVRALPATVRKYGR